MSDVVVVEDSTSDYDASIGPSEFTSLKTSHIVHAYECGRRYQGSLRGRYGLPNDHIEEDREALKHKLYMDYILEGQLCRSPIGDYPQKIVDLGTGFGFWAQDVAERYPSTRVIGTDISPIQPLWVPPNLEFCVEDLEDETRPWSSIYRDADLIHIRATAQTLRNPRRIFEQAFESLRPGGWLESHEIIPLIFSDDDTADSSHPMNTLYSIIQGHFSSTYGWSLPIPRLIPTILEEIGFTNIHQKHNHLPLGRWHHEPRQREVGMFNLLVNQDWCFTMLANPAGLGIGEEEAKGLGKRLEEAFRNPAVHAKNDYVECWAQKPYS